MTNRRRILIVAALSVLTVFTVYSCVSSGARSAVEQSDARIREKGFPVTAAELDRWRNERMPMPEANASLQYLLASMLLDMSEFPDRNRLPVLGEAGLPPLGSALPEDTIQLMRAFASQQSEAFDLLDRAASLERSGFGGDSSNRANIHGAMRALQLRVLESMAADDADQAISDVQSFLHGANSLRSTPSFMACRDRSTWLTEVAKTIELLLNNTALDANQLTRLNEILQPIPNDDGLLLAIIGERSDGIDRTARIARPLSPFQLADYCEYFDHYIAIAEDGLPNRAADLTPEARDAVELPQPYPANLHGLSRGFYDAHAAMEAARAAVLVLLHREAASSLPETIEEIPEELRADWPTDPYTGDPLQYKPMDAGFITFSMGYDGSGDGNLPSGAAPNAHRESGVRDLVFRILK